MKRLKFLLLVVVISVTVAHGQKLRDTLIAGQGIVDGQSLISARGIFELGFFRPPASNYRYLGIWYRNMQAQTVIWVANRDNPIRNTNAQLNVTTDGIYLYNSTGGLVWTPGTRYVNNLKVSLLDAGNLVLSDTSSGELLWQSFYEPSDTLLPGMRLGYDLLANREVYITSWKSASDPAFGSYSHKIDPFRLPELLIVEGSSVKFRTGPWTGQAFDGIPAMKQTKELVFNISMSQHSTYFWFEGSNNAILWRLVMNSSGTVQWYRNTSDEWAEYWHVPMDQCGQYGYCRPHAVCFNSDCKCLDGSSPKYESNWNLRDFSGGCLRSEPLNCTSADRFSKLTRVKLPDMLNTTMDSSKNLDECRDWCLKDCTRRAYAVIGYIGCVTWQGDLVDIVQFTEGGDDLYIRVAASEVEGGGGEG